MTNVVRQVVTNPSTRQVHDLFIGAETQRLAAILGTSQAFEFFAGNLLAARLALLCRSFLELVSFFAVVPLVEMCAAQPVARVRLSAARYAAGVVKAGPPGCSGFYVVTELLGALPVIASRQAGESSSFRERRDRARRSRGFGCPVPSDAFARSGLLSFPRFESDSFTKG